MEYCHAFLLGLGTESPRFRELYGDDGKRTPSDTELQMDTGQLKQLVIFLYQKLDVWLVPDQLAKLPTVRTIAEHVEGELLGTCNVGTASCTALQHICTALHHAYTALTAHAYTACMHSHQVVRIPY